MMNYLLTKKRLLVLIIALFCGMQLGLAFSFSATCPTGQTLYYTITNTTNHYVSVVAPAANSSSGWNNYTKPTGSMIIPETVDNGNYTYTITAIETYAFYGCSGLTEVTIPEGVTTIGGYAFYNCPGIQTVHFNATNCTTMVSNSQYSVFNSGTTNSGQSAIKTLTIGDNVTRIPDYAFRNAQQLHGVLNVPASVETIGKYAFYNCVSLNNLNLEEGLVSIGEYAFYYCQVLEGRYQMPRGLYIPNTVTTIGQYAFFHCVTLPLLSIGEGVTSIGGNAFWECNNMKTVYFNAVNCNSMETSGGYSVFGKLHTDTQYPRIENLIIGSGVTRIPNYAFTECSRITGSLSLPDNLVYIGNYAFNWCNGYTDALTIPDEVTYIGNYAFYTCTGFTSLGLGNSVETIGGSAFRECTGLAGYVNVPNITTTIGEFAFYHCSGVSELTLGTGVGTIGDFAFWFCPALATVHFNSTNCTKMYTNKSSTYYSVFNTSSNSATGSSIVTPIETLTIGNNVTRIPDYAFRNSTNMTSVITIPDATTYIGQYSFYGARSNELTIGTGVVIIGGYAFYNCPDLATVHFNATNCTQMYTRTGSSSSNYQYYAVFNRGTTTSHATPIVTLTIGDNVTRIPDHAFRGSNLMTSSVIIPDACTYLGSYSFANSSGHNIFTGKNVTEILEYTFFSSSGFDGTVALGDSVTAIRNYAFYDCSGLIGGLTFPETLVLILDHAFYNCHGLTGKLVFPDSLTTIATYAFTGCNGFDGDLVIPNSVTILGSNAFRNCTGFDGSLVLGAGLTGVNDYTFAGCDGFVDALILGVNIETIGGYSFQNCSGFSYIITTHTPAITAQSNSFNSMNYTIPIYIPYGELLNYQGKTGWSNFNNYINQCLFTGYENNLWSTEINWQSNSLPASGDVVCINDANCYLDTDADIRYLYVMNISKTMTVNSSHSLSTTYGVGTLQPSQLVVEDGGSLYNPISNTYGTIKKNISAYSGNSGWYTLSTPIHNGMATSILASDIYDLFYYDEPTHYWKNQKNSVNNFTKLHPAQGCLYASLYQRVLSFEGQLNASDFEFSVPVTYEGTPLEGYTLVGNPYTNNLNIGDVQLNGTPLTTYYKINGSGSFVAYTDADPIHPGEGFLVLAPEGGTLTFTPSLGRARGGDVNEMKDEYDQVGFRLPSHGALIDVDAYNGSVQYANITVAANVAEYGTVSGGGNYAVGSTCTLTAVPNEFYSFVNWTCNGVPVSTDPTYSFTVMGSNTYTANFVQTTFTQSVTFNSGWNWFSTYIDQNDIDGLTMLEDALGTNGVRIVSHNSGYVEPLEISGVTYWYGTLSEITNEQMYKVMTNAACNVPIMGPKESPSAYPITINSGWNWIGYPSDQSAYLEDAIAGFEANDDDIIKSRNNGYATYYGGTWFGTLMSLTPGNGYMYKSNSSTSKTLVFQQGRGEVAVDEINAQLACSGTSSGNYQDNMTITAVVNLNGVELRSTGYDISAYVGDECRGSVRLQYVEPIDRYVAFLTVLGESSEQVTFLLDDGENSIMSGTTVAFESDAALGTLSNPMNLDFGTLYVDDNAQMETALFPNPVNDMLHIKGNVMKRIEVFNVMGEMVYGNDTNCESAQIDMSGFINGIYMVHVMTENGMVTHYIVKE